MAAISSGCNERQRWRQLKLDSKQTNAEKPDIDSNRRQLAPERASVNNFNVCSPLVNSVHVPLRVSLISAHIYMCQLEICIELVSHTFSL